MTVLAWQNWADEAGVALTGSAGPAALPASRLLQVDVTDEAWQWWADGPSPWVTATLAGQRAVGAVALMGVVASTAPSAIRVRASTSHADMSAGVVYDSGAAASHYLAGIAAAGTGMVLHLLPAEVTARFWRLDLTGAGATRAGRLFIGPVCRFLRGIAYDWERDYVDPSTLSRAPGAQLRSWELPQYRLFSADLPKLTRTEADTVALEVKRAQGRTRDVLLVADETQTPLSPYAVWGVMSAAGVRQPRSQRFSWSIKVEERG